MSRRWLTERHRQARTGPAWSALRSILIDAASENGPHVDSGGRSYRLLSEHRPSMPNERGPGLGYDSPAACIP